MGTDYECGCRYSMGHWFLCRIHEPALINVLDRDEITVNEIKRSLEKKKSLNTGQSDGE